MATNIARFMHEGAAKWGVVTDGHVRIIPQSLPDTVSLVSTAASGGMRVSDEPVPLASVELLSPITANQQFVCQGANYRQHMIESGMDPDAKNYNMIFTKATSCICAADADLVKPDRVRFLDYEIELGVVLKRDITGLVEVSDDSLHEYIAAITIVNDYSARDVQIPEMQFYKGKSFRTFGPVGPYLCLLEPKDIPQLQNLDLQLKVNGEVRQQDNTRNLVFGLADTLTELSAVQDFRAGDLIATGTPAGCALSIPSPAKQRIAALLPEKKKWELFMRVQEKRPYLQVGDVVESRISSADGQIDLGTQRNRVVAEA